MKKKKIKLMTFVLLAMFVLSACVSTNEYKSTNPNIILNKEDRTLKNAKIVSFNIDAHILNEEKNKSQLSDVIKKYIPQDGMILKDYKVTITKDFNVDEVLKEVLKAKNININYGEQTGFKYIKEVNNIPANLFGQMSGWLYTVNNKLPSIAINKTKLENNDVVTLVYSNDGGPDVGLSW